MVQRLGVAVVHVAVPLVHRQGVDEVLEDTARGQGGQRLRELVVVQVAEDDDLGLAVLGQHAGDEGVDLLRMGQALGLGAERRRLEGAVHRLVAALGVEVVADDEDLLAAEPELTDQRLAAARPGVRGGVDPARGHREPNTLLAVGDRLDGRGGAAARPVHEGDTLGVEEEDVADVATRLAAVRVVDRVDGAPVVGRAAGRLDGVDELGDGLVGRDSSVVLGAVVVLDLLQAHDVRGRKVRDDPLRQPVELALRVGRVEVLDVVRRHGELVGLALLRHVRLQSALLDRSEGGGLDVVAAEVGRSPRGPRWCRTACRPHWPRAGHRSAK